MSMTEQEIPALADDSVLAVLAGRYNSALSHFFTSRHPFDYGLLICCIMTSGTITPVLTFLVYRLALSPMHVGKIREELKTIEKIRSNQELQKLPHLNAVIHETMRVHPPVLDGLPRNTPAEGVTINGQHIPGDVTCLAPFCTISRRKSPAICNSRTMADAGDWPCSRELLR